MSERKSWTKMEDRVLKLLRQQKGYKKWSEVAQIMRTQYGIQGRNGKQCRERQLIWNVDITITQMKEYLKISGLRSKIKSFLHSIINTAIVGHQLLEKLKEEMIIVLKIDSIRVLDVAQGLQMGQQKFFGKNNSNNSNLHLYQKPSKLHNSIGHTNKVIKNRFLILAKANFLNNIDLKCRLMSYSDATEEQLKQNSQRLNSLYNLIKQINSFNRKNKRKGKKKRKQSSDQQDGDDFSKEEKPKIKLRKNRKISQIDDKKKKTIGESSNIFVKKQQENYSKAVCNIIGKPVQSKNTQIDSQNISGHRISLEEGSNHDYDRLDPNQDDHSDKRKIETFDCINQKAQQGFDINQFYSLQDLGYQEGPSFY